MDSSGARSVGCKASGQLPSHWSTTIVSGGVVDLSLRTQRRPFRLSLPNSYSMSSPLPLLFFFHGWGGSLSSGDVFHAHGRTNGYIVVSPLGFDDGGHQPASWNGAGTAASPSSDLSPVCHGHAGARAELCYKTDCAPYGGCRPCGWTTCEDSVAQVRARRWP